MKNSKKTVKKGMKVRVGVHTAKIIDILPCSGPNGEDRVELDNNLGIRFVYSIEIE